MKLKIQTCECGRSIRLYIKPSRSSKWIKDYDRLNCGCEVFDTVYTNAEQAGDAAGPDYKFASLQGGIFGNYISNF